MKRILILVSLCLSAYGCSNTASIEITDGVFSEGQECFRIETPSATYLYQKEAGGFSKIIDENNTDWVNFHESGDINNPRSSESDFRGLPNMVYGGEDGGVGHPGFKKMTSRITAPNKIQSTSNSGKWQWTWTFYQEYAELTLEQVDSTREYFFLYEGPIAGRFSPGTHYWGTNISGPLYLQPDLIKGPEHYAHWQTVYFGDTEYEQVFFVHQIEPDTLDDLYTYMGNSSQGNASADGMVVFGFGRAPEGTPLLTGLQKFRIGFYNGKIKGQSDHQDILAYINRLSP
ncbi:MAG: hypothetical protein DHS20C17_33670 [Cyclobacteriaceae bacterium]|nr:MAG: hypothetical protein DHS20C17_33670 [Cyclobacteriaceae bacterium]